MIKESKNWEFPKNGAEIFFIFWSKGGLDFHNQNRFFFNPFHQLINYAMHKRGTLDRFFFLGIITTVFIKVISEKQRGRKTKEKILI